MKADRLLLELLSERMFKEAPKKNPTAKRELTLKQVVKVAKLLPEIQREINDAVKALEKKDDKSKDKLTFSQKWILSILAALTLPPLYILLIHALFAAVTGK